MLKNKKKTKNPEITKKRKWLCFASHSNLSFLIHSNFPHILKVIFLYFAVFLYHHTMPHNLTTGQSNEKKPLENLFHTKLLTTERYLTMRKNPLTISLP